LEELLVSGDWVKMTDKLWQIINEEQQVAVWKETAGSRLES
jgi:hypothetical protein